jgi:Mg2+ and Co2+ transporter CorA
MVDPAMSAGPPENIKLILRDPTIHKTRTSLWHASDWAGPGNVEAVEHRSAPYQDGCHTLAPCLFPHLRPEANDRIEHALHQKRDRESPLDELVFYWTKIASKELVAEACSNSSNTTHFLLKHIAQHWLSQLELMNCTIAMGEYFSDDCQVKLDDSLRGDKWRAHLHMVSRITKDINYMRRQTTHFWRAMVYNLERLGVQLGNKQVDEALPRALREAQRDFTTLDARLELLRRRVDSLTVMATDLMNLCAAFKGIHDSEFNLRLGLFASLVFPLTLVAGIFSMGDDFLPGHGNFWIYWAASVPLFLVSALVIDQGYTLHRVARLVGAQLKRGKEKVGGPRDVGPGGGRGWMRRRSLSALCLG